MLCKKKNMRNNQFDPKRERICIVEVQQQQHGYAALSHINKAASRHRVGISMSCAVEIWMR
jgi:hypothetical protein